MSEVASPAYREFGPVYFRLMEFIHPARSDAASISSSGSSTETVGQSLLRPPVRPVRCLRPPSQAGPREKLPVTETACCLPTGDDAAVTSGEGTCRPTRFLIQTAASPGRALSPDLETRDGNGIRSLSPEASRASTATNGVRHSTPLPADASRQPRTYFGAAEEAEQPPSLSFDRVRQPFHRRFSEFASIRPARASIKSRQGLARLLDQRDAVVGGTRRSSRTGAGNLRSDLPPDLVDAALLALIWHGLGSPIRLTT